MKYGLAGIGLTALLTLSACGQSDYEPSPSISGSGHETLSAGTPELERVVPALRAREESSEPFDPALQQYIAYAYNFHLQYAAPAVEPAMDAHRAACMEAGADTCQVISSSSTAQNENRALARLQIRAAPDWLQEFLSGLEDDVTGNGGEITSSNMSSTDLSRPILDAEARLSAQRALRERLTTLLTREDAEIDDLVALESELARVQGNIESAESNLRNMRGRVTMSVVDLRYTTRVTVTSAGATNPVVHALRDIVRNFSNGLSAVITFIALFAPWLILIIPGLWLLGRWRKRVNERKRAEKAKG